VLSPVLPLHQGLRFCGFCCSGSQLQNWALCQPCFELNSINSQKKSENLQLEKCRYKTDIEKTFSDTAQYFHSKHLKNGLRRHEKHFFQWNGALGPKRYIPKLIKCFSFMPT
jgi:hypothetical protein